MSPPRKERPQFQFEPDVPESLLEGKTQEQRYLYEQASIHRQQNDAILARLADGEERFDSMESDREDLQNQVDALAKRVTLLENAKIWLLGAAAVIGLVLRLLWDLAKDRFKH